MRRPTIPRPVPSPDGLPVRGSRNGHAVLSEADVLEILELDDVPATVVAQAYGTADSTIRHLRLGYNWSWLTGRGEARP